MANSPVANSLVAKSPSADPDYLLMRPVFGIIEARARSTIILSRPSRVLPFDRFILSGHHRYTIVLALTPMSCRNAAQASDANREAERRDGSDNGQLPHNKRFVIPVHYCSIVLLSSHIVNDDAIRDDSFADVESLNDDIQTTEFGGNLGAASR